MDGRSESNSLATAISKHLDLFVKSVWVFVQIIRNLISCQTSIMFSCLLAGIRLMISSRSFTSHFINMETGRVPQFWYSYFREAITAFYYITILKDRPQHYQPPAIHSSLVETKLRMHWIVWTLRNDIMRIFRWYWWWIMNGQYEMLHYSILHWRQLELKLLFASCSLAAFCKERP